MMGGVAAPLAARPGWSAISRGLGVSTEREVDRSVRNDSSSLKEGSVPRFNIQTKIGNA